MTTRPFISIILPCYNSEKTLNRCIDSILSQTFQDFELILVDDGSTDSTGDICDQFAKNNNRIVAIHKINGGVSSARNEGLKIAKGKWIAFCDSDDYTDAQWLLNFTTICADVDLPLQGIIYEHAKNSTLHFLPANSGNTLESKRDLITSLMAKGIYGYLFFKLFKRSIIKDHKILFNTTSHFREDEEFFSEYLLYVKSWQTCNKAAYHYLIPNDQKSYKGNSYESLIAIFKYLDKIFEQKYPPVIANMHIGNIKDLITHKCCTNQIPTEYECNLYKRLQQTQTLSSGKSYVDKLILSSHKNVISRHLIKVIHAIMAK